MAGEQPPPVTAEGLAASGDGWMEGSMGGGRCSWNIMGGSGYPGIAEEDDGRAPGGRRRLAEREMQAMGDEDGIFFYILYYALLMVLFSYGLSMG